ncbi:MAG: hypothetical protein V4726_11745 [Verrucomicrobiota bacterium]
MLHNNLQSRLRLSTSRVPTEREALAAQERSRVKEATRRLRTHAEKIAWHLAEMAASAAAAASNAGGGANRPAHS